jgi:hypothetical protein
MRFAEMLNRRWRFLVVLGAWVRKMIRAVGTLAVLGGITAAQLPNADAYPPDTCSDTYRTNIPAGDPDYGSWLDRDGDGVACESSNAGYMPAAPLMAPPRVFTTFIVWLDVDCIMVRYPAWTQMVDQSVCDSDPVSSQGMISHGNWIDHTASRGQLIGADPVMGDATMLSCKVVDQTTDLTLKEDRASAGDGHDVNCIMPAP